MKTASWSLALVAGAGSAIATGPPAGYSWPSSWPASSSKSLVPSGYSSSPAASSSTPDGPIGTGGTSSYPVGPTGGYSSYPVGPTGTAGTSSYPASSGFPPGGYGNSSCTTTYLSSCTETSTLIFRSSTELSLTTITHTLTTSFAGKCPATISVPTSTPVGPASGSSVPVGPASGTVPPVSPTSPVGPVSSPTGPGSTVVTTVVTDYTTIYTTICPVTETQTDGGATSYTTTSTVTSVIPTATITYTAGPTTTGGLEPSPIGGPSSYQDGTTTVPVGPAGSAPGGGWGSWPDGGWGSWPSGPWGSWPTDGPSPKSGDLLTTQYSTEYETTCPGEVKTFNYGSWSDLSYTEILTTTTTDFITTTVTFGATTTTDPAGPTSVGPVPTGPGGYSSPVAPYPTWGSSSWSGYASGSGLPYPAGNKTESYYPTGTSASASTCSTPKPTGKCVPCEGQSGTPENFCGLDINTNWYDEVPKTCKTVEYTWTISNETITPDGVARPGFVINGQMPGPAIEASWGDTVVVHVTNNLPADGRNGTTIHFHGIHQNYTNIWDGVPSLTQCPLAPGDSMTYTWVATSYGSSWWHAHYTLQAYDGIFGPMVIDGPAAAEYDDEQIIMLQDWTHETADTIYQNSIINVPSNQGSPPLDTGLINGMNIWPETGSGQRFEMTVAKGSKYRFRITSAAIASTFKFYIDQHQLSIIAVDFVPIKPYTADYISINPGQRYDVVVEFNQAAGNYWLRADNQQCSGTVQNMDVKAIIHYAGSSGTPTSPQYTYTYPDCLDEPAASLVPIVPWNVGGESDEISEDVAITVQNNVFKWALSGTSFYAEWADPTLESIVDNGTVPTTSGNLAIEVPNLGEWVYVVITNEQIPIPHPIHLHGHDFMILAQGLGDYSSSVALNLENPPRRDTATMPADPTTGTTGYLVIAYYTNNPGVWLLHCHIGWHNSMGFALQIIENLDGIKSVVDDSCSLKDTCKKWVAYADSLSPIDTAVSVQDDGA